PVSAREFTGSVAQTAPLAGRRSWATSCGVCRAARPRMARLHVVGMPLDPVLDAVTVLTPQLIDEARVGIEPGPLRGRPLVSVDVLVHRRYLRSDLKPARSSSEGNFGRSRAAEGA